MTNLSRSICESYEELICYVSWASIETNSWPQNMVVSKFGISKLPGNGPHFQGLFAVSFREDILYSFTSHHPIIHPSRWPEKDRTRSTRPAKQQPIGEAAAFDREKSRLVF